MIIGTLTFNDCTVAFSTTTREPDKLLVLARKANSDLLMPGFHHSVAVLPLPFRRSAVVKFCCSVKIT